MKDFQPIRKCTQLFGGVRAFAKVLELSPSVVTEWAKGVNPVPIKRCVQIEKVTKGKITRQDLRPDDWQEIWPELK